VEKRAAIGALPDLGVRQRHSFEQPQSCGDCWRQLDGKVTPADVSQRADHHWYCAAGADVEDIDWVLEGESHFVFLWLGRLQQQWRGMHADQWRNF
jgi:hypothetical protein